MPNDPNSQRPSGGTTQMMRMALAELEAEKTERKKNTDFQRRAVGAVFLFVWLGVDTFERIIGIEHLDWSFWHMVKDILPLIVGLVLFAPDGLAIMAAALKTIRR